MDMQTELILKDYDLRQTSFNMALDVMSRDIPHKNGERMELFSVADSIFNYLKEGTVPEDDAEDESSDEANTAIERIEDAIELYKSGHFGEVGVLDEIQAILED